LLNLACSYVTVGYVYNNDYMDLINNWVCFNYKLVLHAIVLPIMLALCFMLLYTYYTQNYAGIIAAHSYQIHERIIFYTLHRRIKVVLPQYKCLGKLHSFVNLITFSFSSKFADYQLYKYQKFHVTMGNIPILQENIRVMNMYHFPMKYLMT